MKPDNIPILRREREGGFDGGEARGENRASDVAGSGDRDGISGDPVKRRKRKTSPFEDSHGDLPKKGVQRVPPNLVGQFGFTEWTQAGKLCHPRFLGLRRDKDPEEVVREEARA